MTLLYSINKDLLLFVDGSADRIGIGTATPANTLDIEGDLILQNGTSVNEFSTDGTLAGNSDDALPTDETITFYLQNTGEYELDEASLFIQLNGEVIPDSETSSTVLPSGATWASGQLLEVEISGAWGFADDTEISLTVLAISIDVGGYSGQTIITEEVRLNAV